MPVHTQTHTHRHDATACSRISFCQKIDWLWIRQSVQVSHQKATLIRSPLTTNRDGDLSNRKPAGKWQRRRKPEDAHSSTASPSSECAFVSTAVRHAAAARPVCCVNKAQRLVCVCLYVSDSSIMAVWAHRETAPSRGRREEDTRRTSWVQPFGPAPLLYSCEESVSALPVSSASNFQSCPVRPHRPSSPPATHIPVTCVRSEPVLSPAGDPQESPICHSSINLLSSRN